MLAEIGLTSIAADFWLLIERVDMLLDFGKMCVSGAGFLSYKKHSTRFIAYTSFNILPLKNFTLKEIYLLST